MKKRSGLLGIFGQNKVTFVVAHKNPINILRCFSEITLFGNEGYPESKCNQPFKPLTGI